MSVVEGYNILVEENDKTGKFRVVAQEKDSLNSPPVATKWCKSRGAALRLGFKGLIQKEVK